MNRAAIHIAIGFGASGAVDLVLALLGSPLAIFAYLQLSAGAVAGVYGFFNTPSYSRSVTPLGIQVLSVACAVSGIAVIGVGAFFLLLPGQVRVMLGLFPVNDPQVSTIFALVPAFGLVCLGSGGGLLYLSKGLWEGEYWSFVIISFLVLVGVAVGIFQAFLAMGNPVAFIFLLLYLRRPQLNAFFKSTTS